MDPTAPPPEGASCMISYSRTDKTFVRKIFDALLNTNKNENDDRRIWVDWEDLPPSNDWLDEIHKGIENSDCFIFVLSPESIKNELCEMEIKHAVKNGKRIVPIVCQEVDFRDVCKELASLNWIFFRTDGDDFQSAMDLLTKVLDADLRHACYHTKLLNKAIDWERHDFEKGLLLKGLDLARAKHWMAASALGKEPKPTTLHVSFITASDHLSSHMKQRRLVALFFAFIVAIGIAFPDWGVFFFSLIFSHFFVYFSSQ